MTDGAVLVADGHDDVGRGRAATPGRWTRAEIAVVVVLTLLVLVVAGLHLGRASLWNDEGATWAISGHSLGDLFDVLRHSGGDRAAALYYLVAWAWMHVFGTSEIAMRSLSVVAATATIPPFYAVARRLLERRAAAVATAFLATSPFLLFYARDARTYAPAVLLVVAAALAFLRAVDANTTRAWVVFVVVAIVAIFTHWFSLLVIAALFLAAARARLDREQRRNLGISAGVVALTLVPIGVLVAFGSEASVAWVAPLNRAELASVAGAFTGTNTLWMQAVVLGIAVVGWFAARADAAARPGTPAVALWWFPLPVAVTVAVSVVKPLFVSRYLIVALPGFALLLAAGTVALVDVVTARARVDARRTAAGALALAVVAVFLFGTHGRRSVWAQSKGREDWRGVAELVAADARPGDVVIVYPSTAASVFAYYARDLPGLAERGGPSWPARAWESPYDGRIPNRSVLSTPGLDTAPAVWVIARVPRGETVRSSVRDAPTLDALEARIGRRLGWGREVGPWVPGSDTVYVLHWALGG